MGRAGMRAGFCSRTSAACSSFATRRGHRLVGPTSCSARRSTPAGSSSVQAARSRPRSSMPSNSRSSCDELRRRGVRLRASRGLHAQGLSRRSVPESRGVAAASSAARGRPCGLACRFPRPCGPSTRRPSRRGAGGSASFLVGDAIGVVSGEPSSTCCGVTSCGTSRSERSAMGGRGEGTRDNVRATGCGRGVSAGGVSAGMREACGRGVASA